MRSIVLACVCALALAGCLEEPDDQTAATAEPPAAAPGTATADGAPPVETAQLAQVAQAPAGPPAVESTIDWEAARAARAAGRVTDAPVGVERVGFGTVVPMLLPSGIVQPQNAPPPTIVATDDGYFATYQMARWDAIVNGSKQAFATAAGTPAQPSDEMKFTSSDGSAQLAFSRFGADYLIEFECRELDGSESCITADEAREFADSLFVAATQ
ncbi:hypothetical protein GC169_11045 [bacterium]|nr:hypothetical protein [bacterium]